MFKYGDMPLLSMNNVWLLCTGFVSDHACHIWSVSALSAKINLTACLWLAVHGKYLECPKRHTALSFLLLFQKPKGCCLIIMFGAWLSLSSIMWCQTCLQWACCRAWKLLNHGRDSACSVVKTNHHQPFPFLHPSLSTSCSLPPPHRLPVYWPLQFLLPGGVLQCPQSSRAGPNPTQKSHIPSEASQ